MTDPNVDLVRAAQRGDGDAIRRAVVAGADVEHRDSNSEVALHHAVRSASPTDPIRYGDPDGIRVLLECGADPNAPDSNGVRPLQMAIAGAAHADDPGVRYLLAAGADPDLANDRGNTPRAITERTPTYHNSGLLDPELRASRTALHHAAEAGQVDTVRRLLTDGTDPNVTDAAGFTPLHAAANGAARYRREPRITTADVAALLLDAGADPNARGGPKGAVALLTVVTMRPGDLRDRLVATLVAAGADPDLGMDGGRSAREIAAMRGMSAFD